jgi:hypothetical protein
VGGQLYFLSGSEGFGLLTEFARQILPEKVNRLMKRELHSDSSQLNRCKLAFFMKIYRQTPQYLEIRATDCKVVVMACTFGLALMSIGAVILYYFRYEIADIPFGSLASIGLVLFLAGGLLLFGVSFFTTCYLSYFFDKDQGLFSLSHRTLFRRTVIRRSLLDIWQLWVDGAVNVDGNTYHYIKIVMNSGEQIKIPNLGSTPNEQEYHAFLAREIGAFLNPPPP